MVSKRSLIGVVNFGIAIGILVSTEITYFTRIFNLTSAPEEIEITGNTYRLETSLNRDFMPISPPEGGPLSNIVRIISSDPLKSPTSIDADRVWVIYGSEIWEAKFTGEKTPKKENEVLIKTANRGPKWGPGVKVDVIVRIIYDNSQYLLKASEQLINKSL
ncbi:MAG: hypothetical protein ACFFDI_10605 [Promethearchaeota archaeon]